MSRQTSEDVLLLKSYDSDPGVAAPHCLHTSFNLLSSLIPKDSPKAKSIITRALVFTHPEREMVADRIAQEFSQKALLDEKTTKASNKIEREMTRIREGAAQLKEERDNVWRQCQQLEEEKRGLSERLAEAMDERDSLDHATGLLGPDAEKIILRQQLEAQKRETAIWQVAARGLGHPSVSLFWQKSLEEAVSSATLPYKATIEAQRSALEAKDAAIQEHEARAEEWKEEADFYRSRLERE